MKRTIEELDCSALAAKVGNRLLDAGGAAGGVPGAFHTSAQTPPFFLWDVPRSERHERWARLAGGPSRSIAAAARPSGVEALAPSRALDVPLALAIVAFRRPDHGGALAGSRADAADVKPHRRAGLARLL